MSEQENTKTDIPTREMDPNYRSVQVERLGVSHYRVTNAQGSTLDFGRGEGLLSPVDLLLAAIAGCASIDVDVVTSRHTEPEVFKVTPSALRIEENGAVRLDDVQVAFDLAFPEDQGGKKAASLIERLLQLSHEKDCTVSRTVQHETSVKFLRTDTPS
ncbi:OsmC family protein [Rothia sp. P6271]|uniref:OsmC family protein n=1 Tax=unclassified Rothia (in: high G+C Gram-positive bacteria) TaxID=2689056 RepID=UPI003ACFABF4